MGATTACSSTSASCKHQESKCSGDPKLTADQIKAAEDACEEARKNTTKCLTENEANAKCLRDKAVCGADNKTDPFKTADACKPEYDAVAKCSSGG